MRVFVSFEVENMSQEALETFMHAVLARRVAKNIQVTVEDDPRREALLSKSGQGV